MTTSTRTLLSSIIRDWFYMAIDPEEAVDLVLDVLERPSDAVIDAGCTDAWDWSELKHTGARFAAMIAAIREGK